MVMKKNKWIIFLVIIIGVIVLATVVMPLHPFFRSPRRIMNDTLRLTPMGMHIDDVANIVQSRTIIRNVEEWRVPTISYDRGYVSPNSIVPGWPIAEVLGQSIVGHKHVTVFYKTHLNMHIGIYWGFDEDGKLIDVLVAKDWDMIHIGEIRRTAR